MSTVAKVFTKNIHNHNWMKQARVINQETQNQKPTLGQKTFCSLGHTETIGQKY